VAHPRALKQSKGIDALFSFGAESEAFLAWHAVPAAPKNSGGRRQDWLRAGALGIGASVS
jgi:hypothetical protein